MLSDAKLVDPWSRTITLLSMPADTEPLIEADFEQPRRKTSADDPAECSLSVSVVDRPTAFTVTLDWRDATRCCYRDQLWVAARARVSGRCAMSGAAIAPGDEIFRPRPARPVPRNVAAMVLASAVEACVQYGSSLSEAWGKLAIERNASMNRNAAIPKAVEPVDAYRIGALVSHGTPA
jgi:hypothetical protein